MIYNGILKLKEDNTYGIFDNQKGEYIELSKEIDELRNSKVMVTVKDSKGDIVYIQKGSIHSVRVFPKIFDIYIGENLNSLKNENKNDLSNPNNLSQTLFNLVDERISISIKELCRDTENEVIK